MKSKLNSVHITVYEKKISLYVKVNIHFLNYKLGVKYYLILRLQMICDVYNITIQYTGFCREELSYPVGQQLGGPICIAAGQQ